jgi:hypothetical protein
MVEMPQERKQKKSCDSTEGSNAEDCDVKAAPCSKLCNLSKLCDLFVITLMTIGYDLLKKKLRYIHFFFSFFKILSYFKTYSNLNYATYLNLNYATYLNLCDLFKFKLCDLFKFKLCDLLDFDIIQFKIYVTI